MPEFNRDSIEASGKGDEDIAEKLSSAIESYIRQHANAVLQRAQDSFEIFKKKADYETTCYDQSLVEAPVADIADNPQKFAAFVRLRDHIYNGPFNINDSQEWADIINKTQSVAALNDSTRSQEGQLFLLKRIFNSPDYTMAHLKRDLKLLQLHPPTDVIEASNLLSDLSKIIDSAKAYADKAKAETDSARARTLSYVQGKYEAFKKDILSVLDSFCESLQARKAQILGELSYNFVSLNVLVSPDTVTALGPQFKALIDTNSVVFNLDLKKYAVEVVPPTRLDIAYPADFDTAERYSKLLNQENVFLPLAFKHEQLMDSIAPLKFDFDRLNVDRASAQGAYQSAYTSERVDFPGNPGGAYRGNFSIPEIRARVANAKARSDDAISRIGSEGWQPPYIAAINAYKGLPEAANAAIARKEAELAGRFQINRRIQVI